MTTQETDILVVDDTESNARLLQYMLSDAGYQVEIARSGTSALELAQALHPRLILLDIMMPGLDGFETCHKLKQMASTRHIPVIFVTARATEEDRAHSEQVGAVDYILKPVSEPLLIEKVKVQLFCESTSEENDSPQPLH